MPTFGRPLIAEKQASNLYKQVRKINAEQNQIYFTLTISINNDDKYDLDSLKEICDSLNLNDYNVGGNLNICFGFFEALNSSYDYLWIVGDDEEINSNALSIIAREINLENPDLIVACKTEFNDLNRSNEIINHTTNINKLTFGSQSFISSTIYKCDFVVQEIENAMQK